MNGSTVLQAQADTLGTCQSFWQSSGMDDLGEMPEVRSGRILARIPWEIVHVRYVGK